MSKRSRTHAFANAAWIFSSLVIVSCLLATRSPAQRTLSTGGYTRWPHALATPSTTTAPPAHTLAYSPDGKWLAVGTRAKSRPGKLIVWDTKTWRPVWARVQTLGIHHLTFSPDGRFLGTANHAGQVLVYHRAGEELLRKTLPGHAYAVAFSPDGTRVAAGGQHGKLGLWELPSGNAIDTPAQQPTDIRALAYVAADGIYLAGGDTKIRRWNPANNTLTHAFTAHDSVVRHLVASADGQVIATAGADPTIRIWNAQGQLQQTLTGCASPALSVAISPAGQRVLALPDRPPNAQQDQENILRVWNPQRQRPVSEIQSLRPADKMLAVTLSPDNRQAATAHLSGNVSVWNLEKGTFVRELDTRSFGPKPLAPLAVDCSFDGKQIAVAHEDGVVRILDSSGSVQHREIKVFSDAVACVDFAPQTKLLAVSGYDRRVKLIDTDAGQVIATLTGHQAWVLSTAFSPAGDRLATGSYDKTVRVWDVAQRKELFQLRGHAASVECVAFSPQGRLLASGSSDHVLRIWDTRQQTLVWSHAAHQGAIRSVAFSNDGRLLASASDDKTIRIWEVAGAGTKLRHRMVGHRDTVWCLHFSPVDPLLLSGGADGLIGIWDFVSGQSQMLQRRHTDAVSAVAFGRDGSFFLSGGYDKQLLYWPKRSQRTLPRSTDPSPASSF